MNAITPLMSFVEANRINELMVLELFAFFGPRTAEEWVMRGGNAARENAIREETGFFTQAFFPIGISWLMTQGLMRNNAMGLNPKGLRLDVLEANTLKHFGETFAESLEAGKTPAQVRQHFLNRILTDLHATDPNLITDGIIPHLDELAAKTGETGLSQAAKVLSGEHAGEAERRVALAQYFDHAPVKGLDAKNNLVPFDALIKARHPDLDPASKAYAQARLKLANSFAKAEKSHLKTLSEAAEQAGITGRVNLGPIKDVDRNNILRSLRVFMSEYADRALSIVDKHGQVSDSLTLTPAHKTQISHFLFGTPADRAAIKQLWKPANWLPKLEHGLIPATLRTKPLLTWVPFVVSIACGMASPYLNNLYTKKVNNGSNASPVENFRHLKGQPAAAASAGKKSLKLAKPAPAASTAPMSPVNGSPLASSVAANVLRPNPAAALAAIPVQQPGYFAPPPANRLVPNASPNVSINPSMGPFGLPVFMGGAPSVFASGGPVTSAGAYPFMPPAGALASSALSSITALPQVPVAGLQGNAYV